MGLAALSVVGVGTAGAAKLITGKDIRNGTIAAVDIKKGTITPDRLNKTLRGQIAKASAQGPTGPAGSAGAAGAQGPVGERGLPGDTGPQGPGGPAGLAGKNGAPGADGVSGYAVTSATSDLDASNAKTVTATCPAGKKALGGGASLGGANDDVVVQQGTIQAGNESYSARAFEINPTGNSWMLHVRVICADVN